MKQLIKYSATWCVPCKDLSKTLATINLEANGITFTELDADKDTLRFREQDIRTIPTLILLEDGVELRRLSGNKTLDQLNKFLNI